MSKFPMVDYLNKLKDCNVEVGTQIDFVRIGRTVYVRGWYINANGDWSMALSPSYRTDWVTATDAGPYPALLPAAYKHTPSRTFADPNYDGGRWYIAGWNNAEQMLWVHPSKEADTRPPIPMYNA
jgi:hypothetical protein